MEELHLTAPFYDSGAAAVGRLVELLEPKTICLYLGGGTSVDGAELANRLKESSAAVTVASYDPPEFVHAKLVGVITKKRAWLLSGSANLSRAALTRSVADHGNVELCTSSAGRRQRPPSLQPGGHDAGQM